MARVTGTAIRPGVSRNNRRYSAPTLAKAAKRLQSRLADPAAPPVPMFASHADAAADNSLALAGRVTKAWLADDGSIAYEGELADTDAGKTVGALAKKGADGKAFLQHVSVRALPYGVSQDEDGNDQYDDLEIVGLDFTTRPGVDGTSATVESTQAGALITESAEEATYMPDETNEAKADKKPEPETPGAPADSYADPGYLADKKPRYPTNTKKRALAAWRYIAMAKNADQYTGAQLKRIKGKIKAALKRYGVDAKESADVRDLLVAECVSEAMAAPEMAEAYAGLSVYNGQGDVNVSGRTDDPGELKALVAKIAGAALAALDALDPDQDGDIDGIDGGDDGDEPVATVTIPESAGKPAETQEGTVPDSTTPGATGTDTVTLTQESLAALLKGAVAEGIKAGIANANATPTGTPSEDAGANRATADEGHAPTEAELREAIRAEERTKLIAEMQAEGSIKRKGLVHDVLEGKAPMSELSEADRNALLGESLTGYFSSLSPVFGAQVARSR